MSESDNLPDVLAGLNLQIARLDVAFGMAADEISQALVGAAQRQIKGDRKNEPYPAISGQPPMNVSGKLRASIKGRTTRSGFGIYTAEAGAYMKYARAVEFGGAPTWTRGQHFPYMQPALEVFKRTNLIRTILIKHLRRA
jgi:hypothetical protein